MVKRQGPGLRVLLVDESPRSRPQVLRELRAAFGAARVDRAGDVEAFEHAWAKGPVDAVILEAGLQWADAAAVAHRVKQQTPDCPVILLTEPGEGGTTMGEDVDDYVVKVQGRFDHLSTTIQQILDKGRQAAQLRKGETRYRDLFDGVPVGLYLTTTEGTILDANPALVQMLGYPNRESLLAMNSADTHVQPRDRKEILRELEEKGVVHEQALRLRRADGGLISVDEHARAIRDERGRVVAIEGALVDMTERNRMESQLRQLTSELQAISMALPDLYFSLAADGTILGYRAGRAADLYVRPEEFLGRRMQDILPEQAGKLFADGIARVLAQGRGVSFEYVLPIEGAEKNFEARLAPLEDDKIVVVVRDITDRVKVQTALLDSERRFRMLVERSVDALWLHDMQGRVIDVNRQACESLGYTREELLGLRMSDIEVEIPPSDLPGIWQEIAQHGAETLHGRHRRKDGSTFPVEMRVGSFEADGQRLLLAQARDVSERERTEAELRESRRTLATLMSNLPGMAYRCRNNEAWTVEFASQGCLALTGYAPEDLVGSRRLSYADLIHPGDRQRVWDEVQAGVLAGKPYQLEYRIIRADGAERWVWEQGQEVGRLAGGEQILEGFTSDITERRQSELQLQESQAYLRSIVEAVDDILIVYDAEGRYIDVVTRDPSLLRRPREEMIGHTVHEILPIPVADLFLDAIRRLIASGQPQVIEYPLAISGAELWFRARGQRVDSPDGDPVRTLWAITEVTETKRADQALRRREAVLEAVAFAAERFLLSPSWERSIDEVLAQLGEATAASRAYLFQCHTDAAGRELVSQRYEWTAAGVTSQAGKSTTTDVPRARGFARWDRILASGDVVTGTVDSFTPEERELIAGQDILSLLLVPVFLDSEMWGFLGYDECREKREWTEGEIDALRAAASALGAAILRQREEIAFRRLEEFHEEIVQSMSEGILVTDADGRFVFGNPASAAMLGYAPGELVGVHTRQVIAEDHWPLVEEADERRRRGLSDRYEVDVVRKDGSRLPVRVGGSPRWRDGKYDGTLAVFSDMTEQKLSRLALERAEGRFRALVERSPAAVYVDRVDEPGGGVYMSPQIESMLGYSPEEWAVDADIWLRLIHPDDLPRVLAQSEHMRLTGAPFDEEYRLRARDGRVVWVRDQAIVLDDEAGGRYRQGVLSDVTQRKEAEETLRALLNATPDVSFLMDAGGKILALNEQLAKMAHRQPDDLIGSHIDAFLPADIAQPRLDRLREVVRTGQAARFTDRSQGRWYDNSVYPIFDDEGYVARMAVFIRDITDQVAAVQALRESEEQFRGLADKSPNMIFINRGGRVVYANAACTQEMGYTSEELLADGFDFMSLVAPGDRAKVRERFQAHGRGEEVPPYEYALVTKNGRRRVAINATKMITYGGSPAILGIVTDITERKQAEESLRQTTETLQAIIQASPLAVTMLDMERKVQLWNPAAERIFGWSADKVVGQDVPFVPADRVSELEGSTARVFAGETITGMELSRLRADGTSVEIDLSAAPLRNAQGQVRGIMAAIADITERKRAERALSATAEKLRTVFEAVTDGISLVNLNREFIDSNDAVVRLHGFRDKAELIGKRPLDLIAEVDRARTEADMAADMQAGRGSVHEYRMLRTDGSEFIGELSTAWLKDESGAPAGLVGITRDITERKRAEETQARHARELAVLYQTSVEIGTAENAAAMMNAVMRQATELLGAQLGGLYLIDEARSSVRVVLGHNLPDGIIGTELALGEGIAGRIALTGEPMIVGDYRTWEGRAEVYPSTTFGHVLGVPIKRGEKVIGVMDFVNNNTEGEFTPEDVRLAGLFADQVAGSLENARLLEETRRRAAFQEAIVQVAAALRMAPTRAELVPIILAQVKALLRAQGAALISEQPGSETWVVQSGIGTWEELSGRQLPIEARGMREAFETGHPFLLSSIPSRMAENSPLAFAEGTTIGAVPLMVEQKATGALALGRTTEISEDEMRLMTAIAEMVGVALHRAGVMETLEEHVQQRTRALAEANDRLKELDRLKSHFVSNVSHELRTPITNVLLYLDLVSQPGKEDKRPVYLAVLKREAERLGSLIEDLLTLSRMDQGALGLNLELRTLDPVIGEVIAVQRARAEAKGLSLNLEPNPEVPPVWIAHQPMIQVITNLLSNAIAYTPAGGHVNVSSEIVAGEGGQMLAARFHNDGPPIPEEDLPQLFQRFFRGKTGRQSGEPGTGLGLAICREIIERHHGKIEVASEAGRGTTFTVLLPISSD